MSDKKYISPEHAIRNILELKTIGYNVQTANAFFKPIGVISPPKGEEHVDGNADKIRAARSVTMAEEEQIIEAGKPKLPQIKIKDPVTGKEIEKPFEWSDLIPGKDIFTGYKAAGIEDIAKSAAQAGFGKEAGGVGSGIKTTKTITPEKPKIELKVAQSVGELVPVKKVSQGEREPKDVAPIETKDVVTTGSTPLKVDDVKKMKEIDLAPSEYKDITPTTTKDIATIPDSGIKKTVTPFKPITKEVVTIKDTGVRKEVTPFKLKTKEVVTIKDTGVRKEVTPFKTPEKLKDVPPKKLKDVPPKGKPVVPPLGLPGFTPGQSAVVGGSAGTFGVQHHRHEAQARRSGFDTANEETRYDIENVARKNRNKVMARNQSIKKQIIDENERKKDIVKRAVLDKKNSTVTINPKLNQDIHEVTRESVKKGLGAADAYVRNLADTLTFGAMPYIAAGGDYAVKNYLGKPLGLSKGTTFEKEFKQEQEKSSKAEKDYPTASLAGAGTGMVAPVAAGARGVKTVYDMGKFAAKALASGAKDPKTAVQRTAKWIGRDLTDIPSKKDISTGLKDVFGLGALGQAGFDPETQKNIGKTAYDVYTKKTADVQTLKDISKSMGKGGAEMALPGSTTDIPDKIAAGDYKGALGSSVKAASYGYATPHITKYLALSGLEAGAEPAAKAIEKNFPETAKKLGISGKNFKPTEIDVPGGNSKIAAPEDIEQQKKIVQDHNKKQQQQQQKFKLDQAKGQPQ